MKRLIIICLLAAGFVLYCANPALATTYYVNPGESIQTAIDNADNGDEIEVAAGTYNEAINFTGKAVRLYSSDGPEVTTIDATGLSTNVVRCFNGEDANSILEGFIITGGNANYGGGMYNYSSSPTVTDCTFSGNSGGDNGGGMYNLDSSPTVTDCTFSGNNSPVGGGMYNLSSNPTITGCTFSGNTTSRGGGMFNLLSSPTVTNCTFSGNSAAEYGGGMRNESCSPTMINCTFNGNSAQNEGGGMYNYNSYPAVTNCTFSGNSAGWRGGGMYNYTNSNATVTNCILWDNTPDEIYNTTSTPIVTYSDVQGGYTGTGNIDADPLFVDAAGGDLRLSSSISPCVDTGDNSAPGLPTTDLAGNPRVVDGDLDDTAIVDMGAFELQPGLVHNITQDIWYEIIQAAIDDADNGEEIEVAAGTYYEAINFLGKAVRLYSSGGPEVTIIDGSGAYHVVQCVSGEGANTILEGFIVTGGTANGAGNDSYGGGMYNSDSSPTVTDCTFNDNFASRYGGGMYNENSSPTVNNCIFSDNRSATGDGGGMCNYDNSNSSVTDCNFIDNLADWGNGGGMCNVLSSPTVTGCTFSGNIAGTNGGGGGMNNYSSSPMVLNCTFIRNTAYYGGGMTNINLDYPTDVSSSPTVTNCVFNGNSAELSGGGMLNIGDLYNNIARPNVTNCIFIGNMAGNNGGGMINWINSSPTVTNCILWGDTPDEIFNSEGTSTVTYSNVEGGWGGTGNIDVDPSFVDATAGNLRLMSGSPCIDAGDSTAVPSGVFVDLDGNPRGLDDPASSDTGISVLGLTVDMGAYEFHPCPIDGDNNCDGAVNLIDFTIMSENWLQGV
jgi:hypothetical protein